MWFLKDTAYIYPVILVSLIWVPRLMMTNLVEEQPLPVLRGKPGSGA